MHLDASIGTDLLPRWIAAGASAGDVVAVVAEYRRALPAMRRRERAASWWALRNNAIIRGVRALLPLAHAGLLALAVLLAVVLGLFSAAAAAAPRAATTVELPGMGTEAATFARLMDAG